MSTSMKPIRLWGKGSTNPPKVEIILRELSLAYEHVPVLLKDIKGPEYTAVNPNGRLPAIYDPNSNITLWESGAIIEYLIDKYDHTHLLSFPPETPESWYAKQWLFFQASGQGPYYGQAAWFKAFHDEKLPSATERYIREVNRVSGVLEGHLSKKADEEQHASGNGPWLVGNKMSYADLAFVPWHKVICLFLGQDEFNESQYPHLKKWMDKMVSRESVEIAMSYGPAQ